ncbi:MAG: S41 family peptidase [Spirochaetales bacterium]|nr:S41 family peptidase [Spirochaetales bacterium]
MKTNHRGRGAGNILTFVFVLVLLVFMGSSQVLAQVLRPTATTEEDRFIETFRQVFRFIQGNFVDEVDSQTLLDGALKGLFESLGDPYSAYLTATDMRALNDTTQGEFGGVGLYINKVVPDENRPEIGPWVEIVSPIEDTPAFQAGLSSGDYMTHINGDSVDDINIDEVVTRLRGTPGSVVEVTIRRGRTSSFSVDLVRAIIEIPTVKHAVIGTTGFLRIIQFTPRTTERVESALEDLLSKNIRSLIVDVRSNPGGLLSAVVETGDLFFNDGLIVGTRGRNIRENQVFNAQAGVSFPVDLPIVVLIDRGSASAAEILAGALQNRDRAITVGANSFGKGSVQQIRSLGETGFRLTMSRYYTPGNIFIDKIGIPPDVEVEIPELTPEEEEALVVINDERRIAGFFDQTPNPTPAQINTFIGQLTSEGLVVPERISRRLIRLESERRKNISSVYDLEYDLILQEALKILEEGRVQDIIDSRPPLSGDFAQGGGLPLPRNP